MMMFVQMLFLVPICLSVTTSSPVEQLASPTTDLVSDSSARIVNGYQVDISEIPYQASLRRRVGFSWSHMCGAVIINNRVVLTAAHCAEDYILEPTSLRIVVGTSSRVSGGKTYDVSQIIIHEAYCSSSLENDIAILGTSKQMFFGPNIGAVTFAPANFYLSDDTEALVSGFGATAYGGIGSTDLLAAKVKIVNQDKCALSYLRMATITPGMICAGASDPQRDACQGDSGGPLVASNVLVGIVSWGEGCADTVYPGVYTRISEYSSWIEEHIADVYD